MAPLAVAAERLLDGDGILPGMLVPEAKVHLGMARDAVVYLPPSVDEPARVGAVCRLPRSRRGKPVGVGDGAPELRQLAAHAANDLRILPLRPFAGRRPRLVVERPLDGIAEAVESAVLYHPARTAVFPARQVHELVEMTLLRGHVVGARRAVALMQREAPDPDRLRIGALVETPRLRSRAIGVENVGEPRLVLVGIV